ICPNRLTGLAHRRGAVGIELLEKLLDAFSRLACFALNRAHQLIHVAVENRDIIVRERAPLAPQLPFDLVPISLKCLLVNHRAVLNSFMKSICRSVGEAKYVE